CLGRHPAAGSSDTSEEVGRAHYARHQMRRTDVGIALLVFAGSVGLLLAGSGHGDATGAGFALTALATLPLAVHRPAPLAVFVVTALAGAALRLLGEPAGPPLGPTIALYFAVLAGPTRLTLAVAAVLLAVHVGAWAVTDDVFPAIPIAVGVLVWSG